MMDERDVAPREYVSRPDSDQTALLREQASFVRHELRGALAVLYPALSALQASALDDGQRRLVDVGERAAVRLAQMIASMGDTGWLEVCSPEPQPVKVDLAAVVEASLRNQSMLAGLGGPTYVPVLPAGLPPVVADEWRLRTVLSALLDNAARFTPAGGAVRVTAVATPPEVRVTVTDTGRGLDPAELETIFAFGERAGNNPPQWAGLGIGLYACRLLVASWGGRIAAEQAAPHGLAVSFTIPVARDHERKEP